MTTTHRTAPGRPTPLPDVDLQTAEQQAFNAYTSLHVAVANLGIRPASIQPPRQLAGRLVAWLKSPDERLRRPAAVAFLALVDPHRNQPPVEWYDTPLGVLGARAAIAMGVWPGGEVGTRALSAVLGISERAALKLGTPLDCYAAARLLEERAA